MSAVSTTLSANADVRAVLDAIPIAGDGDVISPEYHNTLRAALEQLANAFEEPSAAALTRSFAPTLWPTLGELVPEPIATATATPGASPFGWLSSPQHASPQGVDASGWMPIELPDGADVDVMTVRGDRGLGGFNAWFVGLYRSGFTGGGTGWAPVCETEVAAQGIDPPDPTGIREARGLGREFVATAGPRVSGLTPAQAAELRRVDMSRYRYAFVTHVSGAATPHLIKLQLIQVTCTRPGA